MQSNLKSVVAMTAGITVLYLLGLLFELRAEWIFALYSLSAVATIWMALRILKDPWSTDKTFDEYFYLDRPDIRRSGEE